MLYPTDQVCMCVQSWGLFLQCHSLDKLVHMHVAAISCPALHHTLCRLTTEGCQLMCGCGILLISIQDSLKHPHNTHCAMAVLTFTGKMGASIATASGGVCNTVHF